MRCSQEWQGGRGTELALSPATMLLQCNGPASGANQRGRRKQQMAGQAKTAETGVQAGKESTLWRKLARVYVGTTVVAAFMISGVHPSVTLYLVLLLGLYDVRRRFGCAYSACYGGARPGLCRRAFVRPSGRENGRLSSNSRFRDPRTSTVGERHQYQASSSLCTASPREWRNA